MFSYVCFARLHASMMWDVLDMSRDFWIAGVKGLLQVRTDLLINAAWKHSYSNIYYSDWRPFEQWWKLSFICIASLQCLLTCQSVEMHWWHYREINCSDILDFSGEYRAEHIAIVVASEALSSLLTTSTCKSETPLVIWKQRKRSHVAWCIKSVQSNC